MQLDNFLSSQSKVFSFNLFDTVLLRHVNQPTHLFYFVGLEAYKYTGISPKRFIIHRILAEKLCRLNVHLFSSKEDILLRDIYRMLGRILHLDDQTCSFLCAEEMRQERRLIYPNAEIVEFLASLNHKHGKRVIFTSDMYLPFEFLYELLTDMKIIYSQDQLYLSSAVGKRKKSGNLFKHVLEKEKVAPEELLHIGDNYGHDYLMPLHLGIKSVYYKQKLPNTTWLPSIDRSDIFKGIIRTASEHAYLCSISDGVEDQISVLGAYVGGPALFAYVHWVMKQASSNGIKRLYFLARDGQILIRIAELVRNRYNFDLDLRYLYASRHSWLLPSILDYGRVSEECKFFTFSKKLTLNRLLCRLKLDGIQTEWLTEKMRETGLQPDENITLLNLGKAKKLFTDEKVINRIRKIADNDFILLSGYLRQEGLFEDTEYALVDIGWQGTLPSALRRIFKKNSAREKSFTVYFFDLYSRPIYADIDNYRSFLEQTDNKYKNVRNEMDTLMEVLTSATHKCTYGFEEVGGKFRPVFIPEDLTRIHSWSLVELQETMVSFSHNLMNNPCFENIPTQFLYRECLENFYIFLNKPIPKLAEKVSLFPYTAQQVKKEDEEYQIICTPYQLLDFITLLRNVNIVRPNDLWIQGSLALTKATWTRLIFKMFYKFISSAPLKWLESVIINSIKK
ncbi:MAG: hypothetical protein D8M57_11420 [Candidatus Scalindua sp. AMX11]|nr:MAG: hypothetical protein DWQ00_06945 [Candidatus Scalindua sp.]NOG83496.1 HAD hydrolase-like protein [Planctomycetota bacterium]RZV72889.1 MAG: hypothetical protein EX341_13785 [Candidatus Scalindua sp. SCAELEC01]TDE64813.1 MAG: hypothetical protein D8M57_11420 [Candidatus Scalindua sp. AMX11]GJQ59805.1 MAG: hypothetical protein SCALA701_26060 [Candidatus Scalindua sp.]